MAGALFLPALLLLPLALSSLYSTLDLKHDASKQEIKRAYRKLALTCHPDVNKDPNAADKFARIAHAYAVLSDPQARAQYDRQQQRNNRITSPTNFNPRNPYGRTSRTPASTQKPGNTGTRPPSATPNNDMGSDSFGSIFVDMMRMVERGGLEALINDLDGDVNGDIVASRDVNFLRQELDSSRSIIAQLEAREVEMSVELQRAKAEAAKWRERVASSSTSRAASGRNVDISRDLLRESEAEVKMRTMRLERARRLLVRARAREARTKERISELRAGGYAGGGDASSSGARPSPGSGAYRSGARRSASKRSSLRGERERSVEAELSRLKNQMNKG